MDLLVALDLATGSFGDRLSFVTDRYWNASTPCDAWDVHYLVAHVVGGNRFAAMVLAGATAEEAIANVMGEPQLGEAPVEDFASSAAEQRTGFRRAGALAELWHHPMGDMNGGAFLRLRVYDLTLHAWDLAQAVCGDVLLDESLVEAALEIVEAAASSGGMGFGITPLGAAGTGAAPLTRLLDLSGRRP